MNTTKLFSYAAKILKAIVTRKMIIENDCIPIVYENLSFKKIINAIRIGFAFTLQTQKTKGMPITLQVEPASTCNLKCTLCPVTEGMERPTGLMELDLFKRSIDELGDYTLLIILWDWGEPFVNPDIYDMIAYAKQKNIKIISSTNAHVFSDKENAEKLIKSGIDSIILAIDGIKQNTYEFFRQSGNLETAMEGARNIVAAKKALNSQSPLINLRFIVTKHNENEIPELREIARTLGVDTLSLKTLNPYESYAELREDRFEFFEGILPTEEKYQRYKYNRDENGLQRIPRPPPCHKLWDCMAIRWNGVVPICTYDYREKIVIGNLRDQSVKDIWGSALIRSFRKRFKNDYRQIDLCNNCTFAFKGGSCDGETISEVFYNDSVADLFSNPENPEKVKPL